tara:strand:- start:402 stop:653 length:252 start_codon:yes stop_codon:yes gene_type:complete
MKNKDKHIWEGWTVGDFIDEIEPAFDLTTKTDGWFFGKTFDSKEALKKWVKSKQPYYKKHIPEVYDYFLKKSGLHPNDDNHYK